MFNRVNVKASLGLACVFHICVCDRFLVHVTVTVYVRVSVYVSVSLNIRVSFQVRVSLCTLIKLSLRM